jgi:DnaJ-class molecular chaperone
MSSPQKDFYRILEVQETAEFAVIKAAYKALIMLYHPDRASGDKRRAGKKTQDINEAYAVLIDPEKRKHYDAGRSGKSACLPDKADARAVRELRLALRESEAILQILNDSETSFNPYSDLPEFKNIRADSEAILKILNEPD